ncbi:MAG: hypothetical protein JNN01_13905 [Opitutaceae bacterium]|nr:hypothetical protein [Opitutaceae bacterium]
MSAPDGDRAVVIGRNKQLLFDDHVIAERQNVSRVFNPAEKVDRNPIMVGEKPWEGKTIYVGNVLYDDEEGIFKMWYWVLRMSYQVPAKPYSQYENLLRAAKYQESFLPCYATSKDGLRWERPNLGLVEFEGSKDNNLLPPVSDGRMHNYAGIVKDRRDPDSTRRYKAVAWRPKDAKGEFGVGVYFSPDGLHWTASALNPVVKGTSDVHTLLGWDERIKKYVAYLRPGSAQKLAPAAGSGLMRIIGYSTSDDFEHWTPIVPALVPDSVDPVDTQFYGMPVVHYEGFYIGFPWVFRTNQLTHVPQLAFSRDGLHFQRTPLRGDFIPLGPKGDFDDGNVWSVQPVVHGGKIWFYYTGTRWRGAYDLFELGNDVADSIGLATLPLDGFASIEAGPNPGTLTTKPMIFEGSRLEFNLEASQKGYGTDEATSLRIEILDADGATLPGFSLAESEPETETRINGHARWKRGGDVSALAGKPVRLRFHLRNAKLYAFQFR